MNCNLEENIKDLSLIAAQHEKGTISAETLGRIAPELLIGKDNIFPLESENKSIALINDNVSGYLKNGKIVEIHDSVFNPFYLSCSLLEKGYLNFRRDIRNIGEIVRNYPPLFSFWLTIAENDKDYKFPVIYDGKKVYRFIWEFMTGRKIPPNAEIHHWNELNGDNRYCNLQELLKIIHDKMRHDAWEKARKS